jgi:hypothetical protein
MERINCGCCFPMGAVLKRALNKKIKPDNLIKSYPEENSPSVKHAGPQGNATLKPDNLIKSCPEEDSPSGKHAGQQGNATLQPDNLIKSCPEEDSPSGKHAGQQGNATLQQELAQCTFPLPSSNKLNGLYSSGPSQDHSGHLEQPFMDASPFDRSGPVESKSADSIEEMKFIIIKAKPITKWLDEEAEDKLIESFLLFYESHTRKKECKWPTPKELEDKINEIENFENKAWLKRHGNPTKDLNFNEKLMIKAYFSMNSSQTIACSIIKKLDNSHDAVEVCV